MEEKDPAIAAERKKRRKAARTIGKAVWRSEFKSSNPKSSRDEVKAAWKGASKDATKVGMLAVRALIREGYELSAKEKVEAEAVTEDA